MSMGDTLDERSMLLQTRPTYGDGVQDASACHEGVHAAPPWHNG